MVIIVLSSQGGFFMTRFRKNIIHSRLQNFGYIVCLVFILLIGRLYYLQIYNNKDLKNQSLKQRGSEINLYPKRGIVYDKNLIPLTNRERVTTLVIPKDKLLKDKELLNEVKKNTILSLVTFNEILNSNSKLIQIPLKQKMSIENGNNDMFMVDITNRYSQDNLLSHVLGYVNKSENRGEAGIEKVYDDLLKEGEKKSLFIEFDKGRKIILGGAYSVENNPDPKNPGGVKLTIDYPIQKIVETTLDENRERGSVIVADIKTGDILAMASRPNFNQEDIEGYLRGDDMALYNKAIQVAYPPGSLFKIVVLLAALEESPDYIYKDYYCKGYEEIKNLTISCNRINGHGNISLKNAFAKSCNSVFIQLGKDLGAEAIINMAKKLGFGEKQSIGLLEEVEGNLPKGKELIGPAIGNISIGQGNIEATPLQITNMMITIANKGIQKDMSIVKGITTKDGEMIKEFHREKDKRVISESNSEIAQKMLEEVVLSGTAKSIDLSNIGGGAGKTGSAQAILNRRETIHGWFAGYYPVDNPKYAITVFIEEGNSGSKSAVPIFEKICKEIYSINR